MFLPLLVIFIGLLSSPPAQACAVCFGARGDHMTEVASWAIFTLLIVIMAVLGGFALFIRHLMKLSRRVAEVSCSSQGEPSIGW